MNSVLRGTSANVEAWERWPTDKTVQQLSDGSGDKLLSLSSPLSSMSTCCAELSGDPASLSLETATPESVEQKLTRRSLGRHVVRAR